MSKRTLPMNLFHWPNYAPSHWWIPLDTLVSLSPCPVVSSILYCYVNVRFFKYFLHTFCLVRLCDNPLLVFVWKEAKIWTQGTPHAPLSHLCYKTCPTSIVEEPALLCYGRHLQTHDHWLDAKNKKTHSDWISLCDPFYSVTGSFYCQWQVNNCLHVLATNVPKTFTFVLFVFFFSFCNRSFEHHHTLISSGLVNLDLLMFFDSWPLAQAGLICEFLGNFVFRLLFIVMGKQYKKTYLFHVLNEG